jgi:ribose transport system permease protein
MKNTNFFNKYGIVFVLAGLVAFFSVTSGSFLTVRNLMNVARQVSMLGIASVGMMFVILTGGIDLSVGAVMSFVNVVCAYLMVKMGFHPLTAVFCSIALAALAGYVSGVFITVIGVPPFISTLAFMNILNGTAFIISRGMPIFGYPREFNVLGQGYVSFVPIPVIIMIAVMLLGAFILNKTYFGRYFYAIGGNEMASNLSGINVGRTIRMIYMLSSVFAALAGIIMLSRLSSGVATTGAGFEFQVITAVVLGGVSINGGSGKIFGVLMGVLIIGVLSNGLILLNLNEYVQKVLQGIVLMGAVSVDCISKRKNAVKA